MLFERFRAQKIAHLQGLLHIFVAIDRRNAALGGAVAVAAQSLLLQRVLHRMEGQHHDGAVGDLEVVGRDLYPGGAHAIHLAADVLEIDHSARAQQVDLFRAEDARGQQVQLELAIFVDDGMAGVVAALIADDHVVALGEVIDHAALALVAPVDADNGAMCHMLHSFDRSCSAGWNCFVRKLSAAVFGTLQS